MDKCNALIKTGPRKGNICGAGKKVIDVVNGKEVPHCNRHKIKNKQKDNVVDVLSTKFKETLKIEESEKLHNDSKNDIFEEEEIDESINSDGQNILNKLDKQLDKLFNEYGL